MDYPLDLNYSRNNNLERRDTMNNIVEEYHTTMDAVTARLNGEAAGRTPGYCGTPKVKHLIRMSMTNKYGCPVSGDAIAAARAGVSVR